MLYDRKYMQSPQAILERSVCDIIIILLITIFLIDSLVNLFLYPSPLKELLSFSWSRFSSGSLWTMITYGFLHEGPFHLLFNLLGIHFICRPIEHLLGSRKFIHFIIACLICGIIAWVPFNLESSRFIIGVSALVLGALCFFCLEKPNNPITLLLFFVLPVSLKPRWILYGTLGLELYGFVNSELHGAGGIAHSAHLGGMFCGLIFHLTTNGLIQFPFKFVSTPKFQNPLKNSKQSNFLKTNYRVNFGSSSSIREETDRILDKINSKGFGALTPREKETLEKAKKMLDS